MCLASRWTDNAAARRWIMVWLRAWRSEPVVLRSPLPVESARARLKEGRISELRDNFMLGVGDCRVVGRVGTSWISLAAVKGNGQNSFRPVLRGWLEPDGAGCRLVGTYGWSPFVKAFAALWLGTGSCVFLGLLVHAVVTAIIGAATWMAFFVCLIPLGYVLGVVAVTAKGRHVNRTEAWYFQSWLADRLHTSDAAVIAYRPLQGDTPS